MTDLAGKKIVQMFAGGLVDQAPLLDAAMTTVTGEVSGGHGAAMSASINPHAFAARGSGGGTTVIQHFHINVAGSILAERQLFDIVQKHSLRQNRRNPTNGLSTVHGF